MIIRAVIPVILFLIGLVLFLISGCGGYLNADCDQTSMRVGVILMLVGIFFGLIISVIFSIFSKEE